MRCRSASEKRRRRAGRVFAATPRLAPRGATGRARRAGFFVFVFALVFAALRIAAFTRFGFAAGAASCASWSVGFASFLLSFGMAKSSLM